MPKIKTKVSKSLPPPDGYEKVKPTLDILQRKLVEAQQAKLAICTTTKLTWPISKLNHQISRYVYEMYYKRKAISKQLYDWLLMQPYVNNDLIAKWKKQGYEKLCCIGCIVSKDTNHEASCVCRVPRLTLTKNDQGDREVECVSCGCTGCASSD